MAARHEQLAVDNFKSDEKRESYLLLYCRHANRYITAAFTSPPGFKSPGFPPPLPADILAVKI